MPTNQPSRPALLGAEGISQILGLVAASASQNFTRRTKPANDRSAESFWCSPQPPKGLTMNTPSEPTTNPGRSFLRTLFNRQTVFSFLAGAFLVGGVGAVTAAMGGGGWHHGMMMHGAASPEEMSAHIDHVLKHLYVEIDATDAQKAKIGPLVHQAVSDLLPMHTQLEAAHTQAIQG